MNRNRPPVKRPPARSYARSGQPNQSPKRGRSGTNKLKLILVALICVLGIAATALVVMITGNSQAISVDPAATPQMTQGVIIDPNTGEVIQPEDPPAPTLPPIPNPYAVEGTRPSDFGLQTEMELNGQKIHSYSRSAPINFGETNQYTELEGIVTFRGNNFRDSASYGTIGSNVSGKLQIAWQTSLPESIKRVSSDRSWFGSGWTGQPLIVKWPETLRAQMNINESKKDKQGLTEVILGTEGAMIYFLDLEDGKPTRKKINTKWTLKGAGAVDPRGYPLYFVGSGDISAAGAGQNMLFSLIDSEKIYTYGENDSFRDRTWQAFDPSTIVHAGTDSVTYAAESNLIYQFTLNSKYDEQAGTFSINPSDIFKWKYSTEKSRAVYKDSGSDPENTKPYLGFESSPVFFRNYMYVSDNGGNLFCIDINTFEVIWMSDTLDDTNCSPVLELDEENGRAYIYMGTSARATRNKQNVAHIPFWKIDAITGEKVWTAEGYDCLRGSDSGGIQDTAALGKNSLSELVYITYANAVNESGKSTGSWLVAYDKQTGEEVWKQNFGGQCWSSPVDVYDDSGKGYIVYASASYTSEGEAVGGFVTLMDGLTGERLSSVEVKGHVEASPAVYNDMIVIGTRGQELYGIRII